MGKLTKLYNRLYNKTFKIANYCWQGVWRDSSKSLKVKTIKIINLSVRTFLDSDLQSRAAALTYRTLLAIVPAFALLFAIGRGFNLQELLKSQIYKIFPAQHDAMSAAINFVDSYLKHASQGVFVGVGIVFLLWTLISLLSHIEDSFNLLWGVREGRSIYRKITDYTAICLLVPILMVCSAGINIFMSTMFDSLFGGSEVYPVTSILLDCAPFVLTCLAFTLSYMLIPNTKVSFKYSAISGVISGVVFQLVQLLFIYGQVYVASYNAIYGSFAFLPLLLIWLQISWLILLFGCTLTFSMQNIFHFTFTENISDVSPVYMRKIILASFAIISSRFLHGQKPMTIGQISAQYGLPIKLLNQIMESLRAAGVIYYVILEKEEKGIAPAISLDTFTVGDLLRAVENQGNKNFIPGFDARYREVNKIVNSIMEEDYTAASKTLIKSIPVPQKK